jgi:hypothetical protein
MSSTNVRDEQTAHKNTKSTSTTSASRPTQCMRPASYTARAHEASRDATKRRLPHPYAKTEAPSVSSGGSTIIDDNLAGRSSTSAHAGRIQGVTKKCSSLVKSQSCDDIRSRTSSIVRYQAVFKHGISRDRKKPRSTSSSHADNINKALHQSSTSRIIPTWNNSTLQNMSNTSSYTLVDLATEDIIENIEIEDTFEGSTLGFTSEVEKYSISPWEDEPASMSAPLSNLLLPENVIGLDLLTLSHKKSTPSRIRCAFCDFTFSGPHRKQKVIDHVIEAHHVVLGASAATKQLNAHTKGLAKFPDHVTFGLHTEVSPPTEPSSVKILEQDLGNASQFANDLSAIGTKWQDDLRMRRRASGPMTVAVVLTSDTHHTPGLQDPKALLNTILSLVNDSDSEVDPEKANDLFNGLDLIVEDLSHRLLVPQHFLISRALTDDDLSPKHDTVRCILNTLASLGRTIEPESSPCSADPTGEGSAASAGVKSCPASQHTKFPPSFYSSLGSQAFSPEGTGGSYTQDNGGRENSPSPEGNTGPSPTIALSETSKRPRSRLLACPAKKHDEVHGRQPSCSYQGAANMSSLKTHLRSREHVQGLPFIEFCRTCADYIIDRAEWQNRHASESGRSNKQIRGNGVVKQWQALYKKMFPRSERVPHPCTQTNPDHLELLLTPGQQTCAMLDGHQKLPPYHVSPSIRLSAAMEAPTLTSTNHSRRSRPGKRIYPYPARK